MPDVIAPDDPRKDDVRGILAAHLNFAHEHTAAEDVCALDVPDLLNPFISFCSFRRDGTLLAVGALKQIDSEHAELKSMHTAVTARRTGIGAKLLSHLIEVAQQKGFKTLSLETGSMDAFIPARAMYAQAGFHPCGPFADYPDKAKSAFMTMTL